MLAQTLTTDYPLHNNEILSYIEYTLYRLDETKITFENHCLINIKLFQPTFNYPKLYTKNHLVQ